MRRARRTYETRSSRKRRLIGILLIGLCGGLYGLTGDWVGTAAAQPGRKVAQSSAQSRTQSDDREVPGSRGAKVPSELNQIDETPVTPVKQAPPPSKPAVTCCTPGKDCPCTPGVDCPCTPGVNCACTPGVNCACTPGVNCPARPPQRADYCTPGKNCPCTPGKDCDRCIPGKTCPCTPYIDCPNDEGVLFAKDSAEILPETREKLIKFAAGLKQIPLVIVNASDLIGLGPEARQSKKDQDTRIRIEGHVSSDEMNRANPAQVHLALQRAAAVKKALIEAGLPEEYIADARGYSSVCKLKINASDEERNRAVQFVYDRERTGCAFPEINLRPPVVPDLPAPKGKGGPKSTGPKTGAAQTK